MPDDATRGERGGAGRLAASRPAVVIAVLAIILAVVVITTIGDPVAALSRVVLPSLVALSICVASIGGGTITIAAFGRMLRDDRVGEDLATLLVLGVPIFGGIEFLVALVSTHLAVLCVPALALAVVGAMTVSRRIRSMDRDPISTFQSIPATIVLTTLLLTALVTALLPAVSLDEVSYHLAIPKIWLSEGRAVSLPLMSHSFFPLGTESADLPALGILGVQGAISSHLVHLLIAIAGAVIMIRAMPERRLGALGVAAVASTPAILLSAGWSGTDVPLIAVSMVLFLFLDRYVRDGSGRAGLAASITAGLLVKYTFLPVAAVLIGGALIFAKRRRRSLILAVTAGVVCGSIFFVRNLILTGNPIEPFLSVGGGEIARFRWGASWGETLGSYLFDTRFIDDSLGFILPGLALAALALSRTILPGWRRVTAIGMLVAGALLTLIGPAGRILLPFLVVPAWITLASIVEGKSRAGRAIASVALVLAVVIQLGVSWLHLDRLDPLAVVAGVSEDRDWVAGHRRSQAFIEQGSELLDPATKTLILGVNELFWFDGRVTGGANFDSGRISEYLSRPPDRLAARLGRDGIGAILVYPGLIRVGSSAEPAFERQRALVLTPEAASSLQQMLEQEAVVAARGDDVVLYRMRP